jgi:hypothetical protein
MMTVLGCRISVLEPGQDGLVWQWNSVLSPEHNDLVWLQDLCFRVRILWRSCNLTSPSPCLTGPVDYPFASRHKGPGFKSPQGYLRETGILLLALSRYNMMV